MYRSGIYICLSVIQHITYELSKQRSDPDCYHQQRLYYMVQLNVRDQIGKYYKQPGQIPAIRPDAKLSAVSQTDLRTIVITTDMNESPMNVNGQRNVIWHGKMNMK